MAEDRIGFDIQTQFCLNRKGEKMQNRSFNRYLPYLFMTPAIIVILFVFIVPFAASIYISMTDWNGIDWNMKFIGLKNFVKIFKEQSIGEIIINNFKYFIVLVFAQNFLAVLVAILLNGKVAGRNFFRAVIFMPTVVATVAVAFIWSLLYDPMNGTIPILAAKLSIPFLKDSLWLGDPNLSIYLIALTSLWQWIGWNIVVYHAGLQSIPEELYESAGIDGASPWRKLRHITIPMLAPAVTINMVVSTIGVLKIFDLPFIMTQGGPGHSTETLAITIYYNSFLTNKMGYGTALSLMLFAMVLIISIAQTQYLRKLEEAIN
jgi:raffinose/stachyose/melibiose transport system permease protein